MKTEAEWNEHQAAKRTSGGIYAIVNEEAKGVYVGCTHRKPLSRWSQHKAALRNGKHTSPRFQSAWDEHGEYSFRFVFLQLIPGRHSAVMDVEERFWVEHFRSMGYAVYNQKAICSNYEAKMELRLKRR